MKKLLTLLMVMLTAYGVNAKCDWSGYYMKKVGQQQNVYTFQTNVDGNPCIDYWWVVYDYQLKRQDTVKDFGGITQVQLNIKGKYRMMLKATNTCDKCDTTFNYEIDITVYNKADVSTSVSMNSCKIYNFNMDKDGSLSKRFDTCIQYYYTIYRSKLFDELGEYWDTSKNLFVWLYNNYDFNDTDLVYYNTVSNKIANHTFKDSGRHLLVAYWYNPCSGIDTWVMRKVDVCLNRTTKVTTIKVREPKIIAIYDMSGRPVTEARENEILIYLYSDGTRRKVYKTNK